MNRHAQRLVAPRKALPSKRTVLWANQPYSGSLGLYIGVAYSAGKLSVAIRTSSGPRWVLAEDALSTAEAEAWARTGFRQR
jgi:hypothetical protein